MANEGRVVAERIPDGHVPGAPRHVLDPRPGAFVVLRCELGVKRIELAGLDPHRGPGSTIAMNSLAFASSKMRRIGVGFSSLHDSMAQQPRALLRPPVP